MTDIKAESKIYIIESPAKGDIRIGRKEGFALCEILKLAEIEHEYFEVEDIATLKSTMKMVAEKINAKKNDEVNVTLHFSMHGNIHGLGLTYGFVDWLQFAQVIVDFVSEVGTFTHPLTGKRFCPVKLHFSVCDGFNAKVLKEFSPVSLYWALVGPVRSVNWSDSLLAFATLYHNTIHKITRYDTAVERMNLAAGLDNIFQLDLADGWAMDKE